MLIPVQGAAGKGIFASGSCMWSLCHALQSWGMHLSAGWVTPVCCFPTQATTYIQMFLGVFGKQLHPSTPLHLPLATALCVTEKYGIFIPYLRPSLCSFTVPWKPNFYSCQQITFRLTEEYVVAWISSSSSSPFFFFLIFKRFFLKSKKRIEDLFLKIIPPPSTHCASTTEHFGLH